MEILYAVLGCCPVYDPLTVVLAIISVVYFHAKCFSWSENSIVLCTLGKEMWQPSVLCIFKKNPFVSNFVEIFFAKNKDDL